MDFKLKGKKALVVGLGRSGLSTARFLKGEGAGVCVTDIRPEAELREHVKELKGLNVELELGGHCASKFLEADLVVLSPGVPSYIAPAVEAKKAGVMVVSEIELAFGFISSPIVAVTGTNGKTTTTSVIERIFTVGGRKIWVGGNIGRPLIEACGDSSDKEYIICELSSFQLEGIRDFRPFVAILLNITEDHMDRYPSFRDYAETKLRLFMNQGFDDYAVLNGSDPVISSLSAGLRAKTFKFSSTEALDEGVFLLQDDIVLRMHGVEERYRLDRIRLKGIHNMENVMAAVAAASICGVEQGDVLEAIGDFNGLPHRMEFVRRLSGISYYNDSKGTNTGAVIRSVESMKAPVVLIMGGRDKGIDYNVLRSVVKDKVKAVVVFGEAREKIECALTDSIPSRKVDTLEEALAAAQSEAVSGDVVLFSPACSSFDMFRDYGERGDSFKRLVMSL